MNMDRSIVTNIDRLMELLMEWKNRSESPERKCRFFLALFTDPGFKAFTDSEIRRVWHTENNQNRHNMIVDDLQKKIIAIITKDINKIEAPENLDSCIVAVITNLIVTFSNPRP